MAEITFENLQQYRRDLHLIPELALVEFQTHAYLMDKITNWQNDTMTIRTVAELPTAILVRFEGSDPKRTIGYRSDIDAYQSQNKQICHFSQFMPESCMLVATMCI